MPGEEDNIRTPSLHSQLRYAAKWGTDKSRMAALANLRDHKAWGTVS